MSHNTMLDVARKLIEWDAQMGYFDAPVWNQLRREIAKADKTAKTQPDLYIGIYHHRHGEDYALFDHEPTEDEMIEYWKSDYEPDREDEYFDSYHPHFAHKETR